MWNHNYKQYADAPVDMPMAVPAQPMAVPMPAARPAIRAAAPVGTGPINASVSYAAQPSPYGSISPPVASTGGVTPFMAALARQLMNPNAYSTANNQGGAPMTASAVPQGGYQGPAMGYDPGAGMLAAGPMGR